MPFITHAAPRLPLCMMVTGVWGRVPHRDAGAVPGRLHAAQGEGPSYFAIMHVAFEDSPLPHAHTHVSHHNFSPGECPRDPGGDDGPAGLLRRGDPGRHPARHEVREWTDRVLCSVCVPGVFSWCMTRHNDRPHRPNCRTFDMFDGCVTKLLEERTSYSMQVRTSWSLIVVDTGASSMHFCPPIHPTIYDNHRRCCGCRPPCSTTPCSRTRATCAASTTASGSARPCWPSARRRCVWFGLMNDMTVCFPWPPTIQPNQSTTADPQRTAHPAAGAAGRGVRGGD